VTRTIKPAPECDFDFEQLLYEAVVREGIDLDGDDTEGYPFDPIAPSEGTHFDRDDREGLPLDPMVPTLSSPSPLLPPPSKPTNPTNSASLLPPSLSQDPSPSLTSTPIPPTHAPKKPKSTPGSADDIRRKKRANSKRAMRRLEEKRAASYGDYVVKPQVINKYIRPAVAIDVKLDALKLRHTKSAYTGGWLKSAARRLYTLDELVGEGSKFKFKLEKWDGRWVGLLLQHTSSNSNPF
jgi:hypothetical protein